MNINTSAPKRKIWGTENCRYQKVFYKIKVQIKISYHSQNRVDESTRWKEQEDVATVGTYLNIYHQQTIVANIAVTWFYVLFSDEKTKSELQRKKPFWILMYVWFISLEMKEHSLRLRKVTNRTNFQVFIVNNMSV